MTEANRVSSLVVRAWRSDDQTEVHARITEIPPRTAANGPQPEVHRVMVGSAQIRAAVDDWLAAIEE